MNLRTKLPLFLIPLIVIPLLVVNYLAYSHLRQSAGQEAFLEVSRVLDQVASKSDSKLSVATANARLIANYAVLRYYLQASDPDERYGLIQRPAMQKLMDVQQVYRDYYEVRIVLPDGKTDLFLSNRTADSQQSPDTRLGSGFLPLDKGQETITAYRRHPLTGELALYTATPLYGNSGEAFASAEQNSLLGYLVLTIDGEFLTSQLNELSAAVHGALLLTDREGAILAAPDSVEGEAAGLLGSTVGQHLPDEVSNRQLNPAAHIPRLFDLDGDKIYIGSTPLHQDLIAHVLVPEQQLLLLSSDISTLVAVVTSLAILVSVPLLLYMLRKQILIPLRRINQGLKQLGEGDEKIEIEPVRDDELGELSQSFNNMSRQLNKSSATIRNLAYNDTLTGLPNRYMFGTTLEQVLDDCRQKQTQLALLFLDLDNFKDINDTLGHQTGDQLLKKTAMLLEKNLRSRDFVSPASPIVSNSIARLGGDEFIILLPDVNSTEEVDLVASRIINALDAPIVLDQQEFRIGVSIGITMFPDDGISSEELIKNADMAMYQAKKLGKHRYHYFSESIGADKLALVQLEQRLHKAIEQEAFELWYQPQIDSRTGKIVSAEALIRWQDEERGLITPDQFIPLAEDSGLIIPIGEWVLHEACKQLKSWHDQDFPAISVAVNVSGVQLNKADLLNQVASAVQSSQLNPRYLHVELTESAILGGRDLAIKLLNTLRSEGISIALDDFGTGYSSLSYLRTLPIDILKIDRSFIGEINQQHNAPILSSIIAMAHALELKVVAEGVETDPQIDFMTRKRCDLLQGYYYSKPLPADEFERILARQPFRKPGQIYGGSYSA